ncbi:MAG TPA: DegT/DnrJ/EryC1/StrS family aminotransferase [Acidimicrobiia bacterium]|nr:DegT/DnrJ/EryC1/StrS family aminotransferase [Acidimicrobiia bacterium]
MTSSPTDASEAALIPFVDLHYQHAEIAEEVDAGWRQIVATGAFILGAEVAEFESEFARYCGAGACIGVGNGTDALEFALRALDVGPGDEVILPANTFVATAEAVVRAGARPSLVDCDPESYLIDVDAVAAAVTAETRALIPVHLFGQLAAMEDLATVADRHDLVVVEDAAQAQGASRNGRRAGAWGSAAATSFYPGKNLGAYGDAGAVLTADEETARRARLLRDHGSTVKYRHDELGFNSRLDGLQAVVLRAKLRRLDRWNGLRRAAADRYTALLADVDGVTTPRVLPGNEPVWHLYVVELDGRDEVLGRLLDAGIGAGIHYPIPVHLHGAFSDLGYAAGAFPHTERAAARMLSLPIYPGITDAQQERVADTVREARP